MISMVVEQVRWMLLPYLALTMVDIIVAGSGGIIIVVALFCSNIVPGVHFAGLWIRIQ
jgi:hypothetical protein